jgi:hypothetical protein
MRRAQKCPEAKHRSDLGQRRTQRPPVHRVAGCNSGAEGVRARLACALMLVGRSP